MGIKKIRNDSPEKALVRLEKFLAAPPRRIEENVAMRRYNNNVRRGKPNKLLFELCIAQNWKCYFCKMHMSKKLNEKHPKIVATLEHLLPISRGGTNARYNVAAACQGCNQAKGAMTVGEFEKVRT